MPENSVSEFEFGVDMGVNTFPDRVFVHVSLCNWQPNHNFGEGVADSVTVRGQELEREPPSSKQAAGFSF